MAANDLYPKDLFETDQQSKDRKITEFLQRMHSLDFTDKGRENICKRFEITGDQLDVLINNLTDGEESRP